MKKIHVLAVALILGLAAVFGVMAAGRTAGVGATTHAASGAGGAALSARAQRLDRVERALARARRDHPPALPRVAATAAAPAAPAPRVVYHRAAPIVVLTHAAHHGDEGEHELEHGDD
jgi:hypothetical protein